MKIIRYTHQIVSHANKEYYNKVAKYYRENESYAYSEEIIQDVTELFKFSANILDSKRRFLDFGCGSGFLSEIVCRYSFFERVIGIDISEAQVKLYREKFSDNLAVECISDLTAIPFKANTFDMAGCYSVLHHVFDYKSVLQEVSRVLRQGGILYFDFEPTRQFQQLFSLPLKIRRKLFDKPPAMLEQLEYIAEFHHNVMPGIDRDALLRWLADDFTILRVGKRFPKISITPLLKLMANISWVFTPYFFVIAQKK